ncbi:hypothetical protein ASG89_26250 [Paenibacillus sp. Soil766]|uniref:helix-turn-helix domain-containing protein n=1 Tax=Paenibacillus sp. Soil766 TaxID=1736404 RepID=UPI000710605E|nr:helix-turn-helix transcriptional regulator [Paenibacillus sp. Soil766]KRF01109.1 hypothetical protein ASG89_26250 [Paenibacillus sp. Soil766]
MAKLNDVVIGKRIRQARQDLSFTQEEVAAGIGITRDKYANIESGRTACSLNDAKALCDYLGLDIQELLKSDNSSLEGLILFREGREAEDEKLLDYSDSIFRELMGQKELYMKNIRKEGQFKNV